MLELSQEDRNTLVDLLIGLGAHTAETAKTPEEVLEGISIDTHFTLFRWLVQVSLNDPGPSDLKDQVKWNPQTRGFFLPSTQAPTQFPAQRTQFPHSRSERYPAVALELANFGDWAALVDVRARFVMTERQHDNIDDVLTNLVELGIAEFKDEKYRVTETGKQLRQHWVDVLS